ncbi:MAG: hypothetical protein A2Y66_02390 [Nitrospirae bacterium RBG_13_41_22]|nr:MAG: hypothetical protein A2Y66_02390 [Nitrospirae bacterium RBG_13_41_22]
MIPDLVMGDSMKVLMLTQDFPPADGGIAIFVQHVCQELRRNNMHVEVLAQDVERAAAFDAGQSHAIHRYSGRNRLSSLAPIVSTMFHALRGHADVLFLGHMLSTYGLGAWLLWRFLRVPYVILVHGFDLVEYWRQSRLDNFASTLVLQDAALIFANSEYTKGVILEKVRDTKGQVVVINPGVDPDMFKPGLETSAIKQQYGIGDDRVILTVSRLVPKKNHDNVLRALPEVLQRIPNLKYLIIGEGSEKTRLESMARQLGIQERVIFTGFVEHTALPPYYCLCDVFIMPSCVADGNLESFGIVFAEASACGKPVIGSKTGGISDAVVNGVTGLLVEPDDTKEIAQALSRLLTDEQLALTLGKNGRARVENELTWQVMGERIVAFLQGLKSSTRDVHV